MSSLCEACKRQWWSEIQLILYALLQTGSRLHPHKIKYHLPAKKKRKKKCNSLALCLLPQLDIQSTATCIIQITTSELKKTSVCFNLVIIFHVKP